MNFSTFRSFSSNFSLLKIFQDVSEGTMSISLPKEVNTVDSAGIAVFRMNFVRGIEILRSVGDQDVFEASVVGLGSTSQRIEKLAGSISWKMKHDPVRSRSRTRIGVDDVRSRSPSDRHG
jgi:hypothetical protein